TDPCRRVQPEPDPAQTAGCGHATGAEKPCWASVFPTFVLSAVPGEGRFADPDALSRRWPAKGTIVSLPHTGSPPAILELFYHGLLRAFNHSRTSLRLMSSATVFPHAG